MRGLSPVAGTPPILKVPTLIGWDFFARSPSGNCNDVARVHSTAARFPARFPQIPLSVISRDASARDATSSIYNDLQAAGSISNLVGRWGMKKDYFGVRLVQFGLIFINSPSTQTSVFALPAL